MKSLLLTLIILFTCTYAVVAAEYTVRPDGTGDYATIQSAINAASDDDTIILTDGVFQGDGNRDLTIIRTLTIRSQNSDPEACIIDCEGGEYWPHRGLSIIFDPYGGTEIEGITITGAYTDNGGAIYCYSGTAPQITNCIITGNIATGYGGGIYCDSSDPEINNCIITDNQADVAGGGLYCEDHADATVESSLFTGNSSALGGAIHLSQVSNATIRDCTLQANYSTNSGAGITCSYSSPIIENTIISFSTNGYALLCLGDCEAVLSCSDIFGNHGGDWYGDIADQLGVNGNISADPLYCNAASDDFTLRANSPCAPDFSGGCGTIGIFGVSCPDELTSYLVHPDGSGPYPDIQFAINSAAPGDTILLADGVFTGGGNRNIDCQGKELVIRSQSGDPELCIINFSYNPGFSLNGDVGPGFMFEGLTMKYAEGDGLISAAAIRMESTAAIIYNCIFESNECIYSYPTSGSGGAISCRNSDITLFLSACRFIGNSAEQFGGAIFVSQAPLEFSSCEFEDNQALTGGALYFHGDGGGEASISSSIFTGNQAETGGACYLQGDFPPLQVFEINTSTFFDNSASVQGGGLHIGFVQLELDRCIIADCGQGEALSGADVGVAFLSCCDLYGNSAGDWTEYIIDQLGQDGNISANPLFCSPYAGDLTLRSDSPCLAGNNEGCGDIGRYGLGCDDGVNEYLVEADGSGPYSTIQAAINAASPGETVLLGDGTFTGDGNRDLSIHGKEIAIRSVSGDPALCIINCQGSDVDLHGGITMTLAADVAPELSGLTITDALGGLLYSGGEWDTIPSALAIQGGSPVIENCHFDACENQENGGAISIIDADSPEISNCIFSDNETSQKGGAIYTDNLLLLQVSDCDFYGNESAEGGAIYIGFAVTYISTCNFIQNTAQIDDGATVFIAHSDSTTIDHCLFTENVDCAVFAFYGDVAISNSTFFGNLGGSAVIVHAFPTSTETLELQSVLIAFNETAAVIGNYNSGSGILMLNCNDIYGNTGGDWTGVIADYFSSANISEDPQFCDAAGGDFTIYDGSPCNDAPFGCGQIGAFGVGCDDGVTGYLVSPDGGGDYPTIQYAINQASSGDTVLLADGVFNGDGNRDLDFGGTNLTVKSLSGDPTLCIIDCEGGIYDQHRGFRFRREENSASRVQGISIINGYIGMGAGICCGSGTSPMIVDCIIADNTATSEGGGLDCTGTGASPEVRGCLFEGNYSSRGGGVHCQYDADPLLIDCRFISNSAGVSGGAIYMSMCNPIITGCTLYGNSAGSGSDLKISFSSPELSGNIIAFGVAGEAVDCSGTDIPTFSCCDIYGNPHGNWTGEIADQLGQDGNISEDPLFCDAADGDLSLRSNSPCAPLQSGACGQIGAFGVGCQGSGTSYLVDAAGGGDFLTIAEGLTVATAYDTVFVACGEYQEHGLILPAGVLLISETEVADCVTIDGQSQGRIIDRFGEGDAALIRGFTLTGGWIVSSGAALRCQDAELIVEACAFTDNQADNSGAAIYASGSTLTVSGSSFTGNSANHGGACNISNSQVHFQDSSFEDNSGVYFGGALRFNSSEVTLRRCLLAGNEAASSGGAVFAYDSTTVAMGLCTFYGNKAPSCSAVRVSTNTQATIDSSLIAFAPEGVAVVCVSDSWVELICSDIFGNTDGDWTGCIADQLGENGNISEDPLFCDVTVGDYTVDVSSPCLPGGNSCSTQMGAFGEGCDELTGLAEEPVLPARFYLAQNAPNPFNPTTVIRFGLPTETEIDLRIYDISGRCVRVLIGGRIMPAAHHEVTWHGRDDAGHTLASGVYFYRLKADEFTWTEKMILLK